MTGTDTDVGKTFVGRALLRHAASLGMSTLGLKPVAAGCERHQLLSAVGPADTVLRNSDALLLQAASTIVLDYDKINPVALEPAIAPHIAAEQTGQTDRLKVSELANHIQSVVAAAKPDFLIVEGAGGWLVPLSATDSGYETFADLARELQYPVILVVALRLGCINHALLSQAAIRQSGLKLAGWVANPVSAESMPVEDENLRTLDRLIEAPRLASLPYYEGVTGGYTEAAAELITGIAESASCMTR